MLFDRYVVFSTYIEKLYKDIQKVKTERMNRFGLRSTDVSVLIMASRHPDGLTVTELATECGVDKATVESISQLAEQAVSEVSQGISQSDLDNFYRTLEKITQNISRLIGTNKTGEEAT